jgi:phosphoribosylanthranilate isomerase
MPDRAMTRIKICGITNRADAFAALELGADALGFVFEPTSPRYIGNNTDALRIPFELPPSIIKVAVHAHVVNADEEGFDAIQFLSIKKPESIHGRKVIKAFSARDMGIVVEIEDYTGTADEILLDAYHPNQYGGTGQVCDWELARSIRQKLSKPLILAGGLNPENVVEAIRKVRPHAVDVSSGVEAEPGRKDHAKLKAFIQAVRELDTVLEETHK